MEWKPGSRKRALSTDEAELWSFAMRDARALKRRGLTSKPHPPSAETAPTEPALAPPPPAKVAKPAHPPIPPPAATHHKPLRPNAPTLSAYDENERRRIGKNPELIDARLDLHGFRQRDAHAALRAFLLSCSMRGLRHVLIITGKGTAAERQRDFYGEQRGVLRRLVPQWLSEPDLRGIVISYAVSHTRHGGEGALYVRLRKAGGR